MEPTKFENRAELPEPMTVNSSNEALMQGPEVAPSYGTAPIAMPADATQPQNSAHQTPFQQPAIPQPSTKPEQVNTAIIADDADLIEKEWVLKAKAIVAQTSHDPNVQTKEVSKMKADYLKKRYNKQLKLDES